jgi:hypothetical protein
VRQGTCRLIYAAFGCVTFSKWALMTQSRSGLSVTAPNYAQTVEKNGEKAMQTSLCVNHASGGQARFSLAVPMSADPTKPDAWTRRKYDRQVVWAAARQRQMEKDRKRAVRAAWWREFFRRPDRAIRKLFAGSSMK